MVDNGVVTVVFPLSQGMVGLRVLGTSVEASLIGRRAIMANHPLEGSGLAHKTRRTPSLARRTHGICGPRAVDCPGDDILNIVISDVNKVGSGVLHKEVAGL